MPLRGMNRERNQYMRYQGPGIHSIDSFLYSAPQGRVEKGINGCNSGTKVPEMLTSTTLVKVDTLSSAFGRALSVRSRPCTV